MEKPSRYRTRRGRTMMFSAVILLGTAAFSCCVAAEFEKAKDMKVDGSLCSLPRSPAFGLGIAALVCLSAAQILLASAAQPTALLCAGHHKNTSRTTPILPISLLLLSWVSFGLSAVLLGTGSSMNKGQGYGRGWLDGECYVVKDGVFIGAAVTVAATLLFGLAFTYSITSKTLHRRTGPDLTEAAVHDQKPSQQHSGSFDDDLVGVAA